jgi:hypothetical protein
MTEEYVDNPVMWQTDNQYFHIRLESLLHSSKNERKYFNFKIVIFRTNDKLERIDMAEFFMHYRKLRAFISRLKYIAQDSAFKDLSFEWVFTSKVPGKGEQFRNLTIRFTRNNQLLFIFKDDSKKDLHDESTGFKYTGNLMFPMDLTLKTKKRKLKGNDIKTYIISDAVEKFDELINLDRTIDNWEVVASREVFAPIKREKE